MPRPFSVFDPRFESLLGDFDEDFLEKGNGSIYGLWSDLTLAYLNPAWFVFAFENGGEPMISRDWTLGRSVLDCLPPPLRNFFATNYRRCLQEGRPWEHVYECSSPDRYRRFHLNAFPLGKSEGLLIVNSPVVETPLQPSSLPVIEVDYRDHNGFMVQCCCCRKYRRTDRWGAWDWIRDWVAQVPARVSHGICPTCFGFYYSEARGDDEFPEMLSTVGV